MRTIPAPALFVIAVLAFTHTPNTAEGQVPGLYGGIPQNAGDLAAVPETDPNVLRGLRLKELQKQPWFDEATRRIAALRESLAKRQKELEAEWGTKTAGILREKMTVALKARGLTAAETEAVFQNWDPAYQAQKINALYEWLYPSALGDLALLRLGDMPMSDHAIHQKSNLVIREIVEGAPPRPPPPDVTPTVGGGVPPLDQAEAAYQKRAAEVDQATARTLAFDRKPIDDLLARLEQGLELIKHDDALIARVMPAAIESLVRRSSSGLAAGPLRDREGDAGKKAADLTEAEMRIWNELDGPPVPWFGIAALLTEPHRPAHPIQCTSPKAPYHETLRRIEAHMNDLAARFDAFAKSRVALVGKDRELGNLEVLRRYKNESHRLERWIEDVRLHHDFGPKPEDIAALDASVEKFKEEEKKMLATLRRFDAEQEKIEADEGKRKALQARLDAVKYGAPGYDALSVETNTFGKQLAKVRNDFQVESFNYLKALREAAPIIIDRPQTRIRAIWLFSSALGAADPVFQWNVTELVAGVPARIGVDFNHEIEATEIAIEISTGGASQTIKARRNAGGGNSFESDFFVLMPAAPPKRTKTETAAADSATRDKSDGGKISDKTERSRIAGSWSVGYTDRALGKVSGIATVSDDAKSVEVTLTHPKTGLESKLTSTEVREKDNFYTILLEGASPSVEDMPRAPNLGDPGPATVSEITLPPDASKLAITIGDVKAEKFISPRVPADPPGHIELRLRYDPPAKMDTAKIEELYKNLPPEMRSALVNVPTETREMRGWWSFRADTVTARDAAGGGRIGEYRRDWTEPHHGWQFGVEVWERRPPPKLRYYAKCADGLQVIEELYLGVATIVEAEFDPPNKAEDLPIELSFASQRLKLVAKKIDKKGYLFRTEPFVPVALKEDTGPVFDPKPPPKPGGR